MGDPMGRNLLACGKLGILRTVLGLTVLSAISGAAATTWGQEGTRTTPASPPAVSVPRSTDSASPAGEADLDSAATSVPPSSTAGGASASVVGHGVPGVPPDFVPMISGMKPPVLDAKSVAQLRRHNQGAKLLATGIVFNVIGLTLTLTSAFLVDKANDPDCRVYMGMTRCSSRYSEAVSIGTAVGFIPLAFGLAHLATGIPLTAVGGIRY